MPDLFAQIIVHLAMTAALIVCQYCHQNTSLKFAPVHRRRKERRRSKVTCFIEVETHDASVEAVSLLRI